MSAFVSLFDQIDQQAPWLAPFFDIHHAFANQRPDGAVALWLNDYFARRCTMYLHDTDIPLVFVSQNDLPHGLPYEQFIHKQRQIPTRDNLHDWFGACIWSVFPKTKALLNAKHIANLSDDNQRNRLRDTITIFDENGAVLVVSDDDTGQNISTSLQRFDWQHCLINKRHAWHNPNSPNHKDSAQLFIFGHALLEQLITPRKPLCSHTLIIAMPRTFFALSLAEKLTNIDKALCQKLDELLVDGITPQALQPLPVLGVPHFWQENSEPSFYHDTFVFRQGRKRT